MQKLKICRSGKKSLNLYHKPTMNSTDKMKSMLLVSSDWSSIKSFRLMPIANDCPFVEGIFDPTSKTLVMMSKDEKEMFHMMPKLDDNGDPVKAKMRRPNGRDYREERKTLRTFQEHYITEKKEIEDLISTIAVNAESFNYKQYLEAEATQAPVSIAT